MTVAIDEAAPSVMLLASIGFRVQPFKRDEALSAVDETVRRMRTAPGCARTRLLADTEDPNTFTVLSEWQTAASADTFFASREFQIFMRWETEVNRLTWNVSWIIPGDWGKAKAGWLAWPLLNRSKKVKTWVKELRKMLGDDICLRIVGNKTDMDKDRHVSVEEAESYAESVGAKHFHTSAKLNKGIEELFLDLSKAMLEKLDEDSKSRPSGTNRSTSSHRNVVTIVDDDDAGQSSSRRGGCCGGGGS
jgi:quinol monooxygenase YgiN